MSLGKKQIGSNLQILLKDFDRNYIWKKCLNLFWCLTSIVCKIYSYEYLFLFFCKYLVISIVLGVIGVGGLVFQWGSGIIDEFFSTFDDLEARLDALEGATTTGTATTACTCDLTAVTATADAACAKVRH